MSEFQKVFASLSGAVVAHLGLLILVFVFGASRLPAIGEGLGKAIRGLKRGLNTDDDIDVSQTGIFTVDYRYASEMASSLKLQLLDVAGNASDLHTINLSATGG